MTGRRAVMAGLLVLALCVLTVAGCGQDGSSGASGKKRLRKYIAAKNIEDGAEKYDRVQSRCPVCDAQGVTAEHYVDVDGKRVYFDKKECKEKWEENQAKYLKKMKKRKQQGK